MGILRTDKISGLEKPTSITSSVYFDGDARNDNLNFAGDPPDLDFQNTDFTFESWVYPTDMSSDRYWCSKGDGNLPGTAMDVRFDSDGQINISFYVGSNAHTLNTDPGVLQENVWSHVAVVRSGTSFKSYVNGIQTSSATHDITISDVSATFKIGILEGVGTGFKGYMSDFRFVRGKAVYTEEFTPPVYALEPIDGTVLLCCNNPDSVAAVSLAGIGTSKTITVNGDVSIASTNPGSLKDFTYGTEFKGVTTFDTQGYFVPPSGTTEQRFPNFTGAPASSARGLFGGGAQPFSDKLNLIEFITISTTGNAQDFGDLTVARGGIFGCSSNVRGVFAGGASPSHDNTIDYVTISSTGDAKDFGDLTIASHSGSGTSNSSRGIFALGQAPSQSNNIDFITISTLGNGFDFGDLTQSIDQMGSCASPTRGIFAGGLISPSPVSLTNVINYVNISSTGNAVNFGDLLQGGSDGIRRCGGLSNATRGLFAGGESTPTGAKDIISFITISSLGDAQDFGDLSAAASQADNGASSSVRGVFHLTSPANTTLHFLTINTLGDSTDFGDMTSASTVAGMSNGHGGLG